MSCFVNSAEDSCLNIVRYHDIDGVTYYEILVKCGKVVWTVSRRYKEFEKLNDTLVLEYSLDKSWLPGKKVIGNKSKSFVKKRQEALEKYIQDVFNFLKLTMPKVFVEFLDFHKYDIVFILQNLASVLYNYGENYLARSKIYTFSVLEAYSISERLKLATPPTEVADPKYDFSNVLEFVGMLDGIIVLPMKSALPGISYDENSEDFDIQVRSALGRPIGTSCLVPDELTFDLTAFRNIKVLKIFGVSIECLTDASNLRQIIEKFAVQKSKVTSLRQILLCDSPSHTVGDKDADEPYEWTNVKYANFSDNMLTEIDKSINLIPKVKDLVLDRNRIESLTNLRSLPQLGNLSLECNMITDCLDLHIQLGNLVTLNLSQNRFRSLKGFQKLYSLVSLDVSCNFIEAVNEVDYIGNLPCLEYLRLTGNPVATTVDYRSRVLSRFGDRLNDIYLDNEKGSQKELDTALVLAALRISSNVDIDKRSKNSFCTISPR